MKKFIPSNFWLWYEALKESYIPHIALKNRSLHAIIILERQCDKYYKIVEIQKHPIIYSVIEEVYLILVMSHAFSKKWEDEIDLFFELVNQSMNSTENIYVTFLEKYHFQSIEVLLVCFMCHEILLNNFIHSRSFSIETLHFPESRSYRFMPFKRFKILSTASVQIPSFFQVLPQTMNPFHSWTLQIRLPTHHHPPISFYKRIFDIGLARSAKNRCFQIPTNVALHEY